MDARSELEVALYCLGTSK